MVLTLLIIRFEIDDDYPLVKEFDYLAEGCKQSEINRIVGSSKQFPDTPLKDFPSKLKIFAGARTSDELCVETIVTKDIEGVTNKGDEVKMSGQDGKPTTGSSSMLSYSDAVRSPSKVEQLNESEQPFERISYFSGNPSVEVTKGILHLYKLDDAPADGDLNRSDLLCMLSVPAKMTCPDLLDFIAPFGKNIDLVRIIRDSTPNLYMVLLKFKDQKQADEFYQAFNGKAYNSLEPEVCHLAYVCKVESQKSSEGACLPLEGATELPTCHICLERMDESVEGILTVLCNHSFHGSCLAKWQDTSCPVCRCCQTTEPLQDNRCFTCDAKESLWICLICGHIGCGRYKEGHAHWHFRETQHTYSMELETQRVWDYTGDNYVHRLVQNKSDGKLVEFGLPGGQVEDVEKLDSITLEYTYLLTSQLESQRLFFEEKIAFVEQDAFQQVESTMMKATNALEECQRFERLFLQCEKEKKSIEKKYAQATNKVKKIEKELKEEREMNMCLRENQKVWQEKVAFLEKHMTELEQKHQKETGDLREQLSDLMTHFEAQSAIGQASSDLQQLPRYSNSKLKLRYQEEWEPGTFLLHEMREGQMFVSESQQRKVSGRNRKKQK